MRICLDPGHGGHDQGADGPSGLNEAPVVLEIAKYVKSHLLEQGCEVKLTRETDTFIELGTRCALANNWPADYFVSIHLNSNGPSALGVETLYVSKKGEALAKSIQDALVAQSGDVDRGPKYRSDLAVLNGTNMPAALVECGFISHPDTEALLGTQAYRADIACAIASGVIGFLRLPPAHASTQ